MSILASQLLILALIVTPLLILARDAYGRREAPRGIWLALAVLAAIAINIGISLSLGR
jgi:hypothetical protein